MGMSASPPGPADPGRPSGSSLASGLLDAALEHEDVYVPHDLRQALSLNDVVDDAERFGAQYRYALQNGLPLPVLRWAEDESYLMPVNAEAVFFPRGEAADPGQVSEALIRAVREPQAEPGPRVLDLAPPEAAESSFRARLGDFLTVRFRAVEEAREIEDDATVPPSDTTTVTARGILFKVFTLTNGLRVHYHPAYWHDPNAVFGQPSSPVTGYLKPGRFVFGATGPSLALRFDPAEYDVPGTSRADLYW